MKTMIHRTLFQVCIVLLALVLGGCGKNTTDTKTKPSGEKISLRLQWFDLAQFAGFYVAKDAGFYRDAGLDVDIRPGGPDLNAITLVSSGSDNFGIWTADHILVAQSKGVPIVILAAIYRDDPNVLMVKQDSPIKTPKDFVGKTVTTVYGRATETVLNAMLAKAGVDKSKVNIIPFPFNIQSFLEGKVDVSAGYIYDHPYQAQVKGAMVRLIKPSDYGIKFYSDCLFARRDFIEQHPKLVEKFVHATLAGWERALANKDEAVKSTLARGKGLDEPSQKYMLEHAEPLIRAEDPNRLGLISPASIAAMTTTLKEQGLLLKDYNPAQSFDNRFVESYYRK